MNRLEAISIVTFFVTAWLGVLMSQNNTGAELKQLMSVLIVLINSIALCYMLCHFVIESRAYVETKIDQLSSGDGDIHTSTAPEDTEIVASTPGDVEMVEVVASPPEVNAEDRQSLGADPDSADRGTTEPPKRLTGPRPSSRLTGEDNNDEPVPTMGEKRASFVATV